MHSTLLNIMATGKKAMTIYADAELYARIEQNARKDHRSVSNYVERLLREVLLDEPGNPTKRKESL